MSLKSYLPLAILAPAAVVASLSGIVSAVGQPAPPSSTQSVGMVRLEGEVREVFGNKVIVEGPAGRTLVETGPEGRVRAPLAPGDKVVVDGMQRDGFVHASAIAKAGGPRIELGRGPDAGPGERPGSRRGADAAYRADAVIQAVTTAGFRDARVIDVKKHHAEVAAVAADGRSYELHVEFDGRIRKQEDTTLVRDEGAIKTLIEKAGFAYAGQMRPEKKHMVVSATNSRGEKVELDVHRDGSIRKERRVF
ncbi:hypothetical protein [Bosea sp. FBZP-16]|uniref:hypothetical protein n=1 Tax=Bosea sp. FBZP-16 TaxID=2065382 RepID=UPI000C3005CE|nr:hypothetical protein [Bosea sp. FBZP-16]